MNNSDFRATPCACENVRVVGAILLPAIVRRRPDFMIIKPACALFYVYSICEDSCSMRNLAFDDIRKYAAVQNW